MPLPQAQRLPDLQAVLGLRPATFLERGVSIPFTTPFLVGARLRPAARGGQELVVANASGGPGVYITSWEGVQSLCCPTLHDRRLSRKFDALSVPGPEPLRRIALDVAEEGLAGRAAATAAAAARAQDARALLAMNLELLLAVIRAVEPREPGGSPPEATEDEAVTRRARAALEVIAPHIGRAPEQLFQAVGEIAASFARIGAGPDADSAPLPALIARVAALPGEIGEWPFARGQDGMLDTALVQEMCALATALARLALEQARALLGDMPKLLRRWCVERAQIERLAERPDWLLDGWERICLVWSVAEDTLGRPLALREVTHLLPMLPREASDWAGLDIDARTDALTRRRRMPMAEDWRTGITHADLIARNERLRALAPAGPG